MSPTPPSLSPPSLSPLSPTLLSPIDDPARLLRLAAAGDPAAWCEIVRRYEPMLRARAVRRRLQEADVHDVVQSTWLRLAEHIGAIRSPDHLAGWLATVVARECGRLRSRTGREEPSEAVADHAPAPGPGPEQQVLRRDDADTVWRAVAALPPRRRELVQALFAAEPRPYAQVAGELGMPVGSLGPVRARTLQELRRALETRSRA